MTSLLSFEQPTACRSGHSPKKGFVSVGELEFALITVPVGEQREPTGKGDRRKTVEEGYNQSIPVPRSFVVNIARAKIPI